MDGNVYPSQKIITPYLKDYTQLVLAHFSTDKVAKKTNCVRRIYQKYQYDSFLKNGKLQNKPWKNFAT